MAPWRVLVAGLLALSAVAGPTLQAGAAGTSDSGSGNAAAQPAAGPRPWLGVALHAESSEKTGVTIQAVADGSPAAVAGIQVGDTLLAVDGAMAVSAKEVAEQIGAMAPGTVVKLRILHAGQASDVTVTLGTRPQQ